MSGPQYTADTQEMYKHTVGWLRRELLTIFKECLNNVHCVLRALLQEYMNAEQQTLMARDAEGGLPSLQYKNEQGRQVFWYHIAQLSDVFAAIYTAGSPPTV